MYARNSILRNLPGSVFWYRKYPMIGIRQDRDHWNASFRYLWELLTRDNFLIISSFLISPTFKIHWKVPRLKRGVPPALSILAIPSHTGVLPECKFEICIPVRRGHIYWLILSFSFRGIMIVMLWSKFELNLYICIYNYCIKIG